MAEQGRLTAQEAAALEAEPSCVGRVVDISGHDIVAWVIPSMTWHGAPRWRPQLERYFVSWRILWEGRRYRSFDQAKAKAEKLLARVDREHGRRERPTW